MAVFQYVGLRAGDEKEVRGVLDADSEREARRLLKAKNIYPTRLEQTGAGGGSRPEKRQSIADRIFSRRYRPGKEELIVFTRQLAGLLEAGFSLVDALRSVEGQLGSPAARGMVVDIRNAVVEGKSLFSALSLYPDVFSNVYRNLVQAGETSGALERVLERLAEILENQQKLRGRLLSAAIYPVILLATGTGVVAFLVTVVVPKLAVLFENSKQTLPPITRSLLALSNFMTEWGGALVFFLLVLSILFGLWIRTVPGKLRFERFLFKIPMAGKFLSQLLALRLCQTLEMLLSSGVTIMKSLQVAAGTSGFSLMEESMKAVVRSVGQGDGLAESLQRTGLMPEIALRMIMTGEQAGNLESMLRRVVKMNDDAVQRSTARLMNFMEPIIVLVLGAIVTYVVVAALLPIFEMNRLIR